MILDVSTVMELYYVLAQNTNPPPRHVLCERVAAATGGFWLYRYVAKYDVFFDDGYAKDLGQLKLVLTEKYGWFDEVFLVKGFENVAKLFALRAHPRIIFLTPRETFCTRISGEVFDGNIRRSGEIEFLKKWIDAKKPKTLQEALERLNEYAEKTSSWIIFRYYTIYASAHLVYPSP
jgi:hypothetical protein